MASCARGKLGTTSNGVPAAYDLTTATGEYDSWKDGRSFRIHTRPGSETRARCRLNARLTNKRFKWAGCREQPWQWAGRVLLRPDVRRGIGQPSNKARLNRANDLAVR